MSSVRSILSSLTGALMLAVGVAANAADTLSGQLQDLEAARSYVESSRSFSDADRAAALARIDSDRGRTAPWSPAAFMVEVMHITAMARNGHDFLDNGEGWSPQRRLPLRLAWLADGIVVVRAAPEYRRLLGRRIIAFDGHGLDDVLQALRHVGGGTDEYLRWNGGWLLEHPEMLNALGIAARPDRVVLKTRGVGGSSESVVVESVPSAAVPNDVGRLDLWSRELSRQEQAQGWSTGIVAKRDPLWLQERDRPFRIVKLCRLDALYIQFRGNFDGPHGESIAAFAAAVQRELASSTLRHVILDQRLNRGGNSDLTEDLMRAIGRRARGRLYVLVGPQTFSAGIVSAALAVHNAAQHVLVVGDTVGDRLRWWSESTPAVCLTHSRYCLHGSTGLWDLVHGCAGEAGCYGDRFDARVPGLSPDLPAPLRIIDLIEGNDPAMQAVERDLAAR